MAKGHLVLPQHWGVPGAAGLGIGTTPPSMLTARAEGAWPRPAAQGSTLATGSDHAVGGGPWRSPLLSHSTEPSREGLCPLPICLLLAMVSAVFPA